MTNKILNDRSGPVVFWSSFDTQMISNAVLLASSYRVIMFQMPPEEAYAPFTHLTLYLKPYRDASSFPSTYDLSVFSCLRGLYKAIEKGWYNYEMFNEEDWAKYEQVENGDMNWLIPGKLLAFASPYSTNIIRGGWKVCTPIDIVPVFRDKKINHVVRLCEKFYDEKAFIENGFNHTELFFIDGSVPPKDIVTEWLKIAEGESVIALHCKAGLGRTGTLAACHMIKSYGFNGHEAIGWIRICRPGSIIGPQQKFVIRFYETRCGDSNNIPPLPQRTVHTPTKQLRAAIDPHNHPTTPPQNQKQHVTPRRSSVCMTPSLQVTAIPLTPKVPQPRKYHRTSSRQTETPK